MFTLAGPLQNFELHSRLEAQRAWYFRRARAIGTGWAGLATAFGKASVDARVTSLIFGILRPDLADLPIRTDDLALFPINGKARDIEALTRLGLPGGIHFDRANHIDIMLLLGADQDIRIHIPAIQEMFLIDKVSRRRTIEAWQSEHSN